MFSAQQDLLDLDHLDRYVAGDKSLRDEVLSIFEDQAAMWLDHLDPASDDKAWRDAAHSLKGAARGVGAWDVGRICEAAETMVAENRNEPGRHEAVAQLRVKVAAVIDEVRRLRDL